MNEVAARQSMKPKDSSQNQDLLSMFNETSAANSQSHLRLKQEARKKHGELNDLIDHLSDKLSDVASSIDKEFLAAYKVHMAEVQSELKSLKQQVVLAEAALNDDTSVAQLETEVKWFSDEVTRLRTHAMSMKKDMNHIVSRCGVLNEQREFLNDQLKQVLKRSRVLEHEIGLASTYINEAAQTYQPTLSHDNNGMDYEHPDEWDGNPDENDDYQLHQHPDSADDEGKEKPQSRGRQRRRHSVGPHDALLQHGGSSNSPARERQQASYRGTSISQLDELFASRCPEEIIFERELEHIFKRMIARKQNEQNRTSISTARSGISGQPAELQDDKEEEELAQRARRMGGVTGLGLEHFSDTDRFTAICNFLDNQSMFEKVVQVLATQYVNVTTK